MPFPNIHTLGPNVRYFAGHRVRGIFQQGNAVNTCDMAGLKAYLSAKLLWNPDFDVETGMEEFLAAYYGDASGKILEYIRLLRDKVGGSDYHSLHVRPFEPGIGAPYLTPQVFAMANKLFREAERLVLDKPEILTRVRTARLSLDYVKLRMAAKVISMIRTSDRQVSLQQWYANAITDFFANVKDLDITHWRDIGYPEPSMEEFREQLEDASRHLLGDS
jgi:hypothetical protein